MLFLLPYHGKSLQETDKEVGPGTSKLVLLLIGFMKYGIVVTWVFREKSKLCIYTKHSSLIINLDEQQVYTFFFSIFWFSQKLTI